MSSQGMALEASSLRPQASWPVRKNLTKSASDQLETIARRFGRRIPEPLDSSYLILE
jgi:hypothetical protein